MRMISFNCKQCGAVGEKRVGHFNRNLKLGRGQFCSRKCLESYRRGTNDTDLIAQLRRELVYRPETGVVIWNTVRQCVNTGAVAGSVRDDGVALRFHGRCLRLHRVIWAMVHGEWPNMIDHINGNPHDNRLCNLRNTDAAGNSKNKRSQVGRDLPSGVYRHGRKFKAIIGCPGRDSYSYLGQFSTIEAAAAAYRNACRERGYSERHGK